MTKKRTRYLLYPAKDQSNKEVLEFPSEEARSNYARNMNRSLVIPSDFPENDSQQQYTFSAGVLPEVLVTPKTQDSPSQSNPIPTQQLITDLNSPTYQDYIDTRYQSRGPIKTKDNFTLSDWSRNIPKSYWSSDTHRNFKDGMTAASLFTAAPFAAEAAGEYVLPWMSENVFPYLTANGWLKSTQAVGNTPAWLTPKVATAIDATLAGSGTAASVDDMRKNGPNFWNVLGTGLGVVGLAAEAAPTVVDLYQSGKKAYNTYQLGRNLGRAARNWDGTVGPEYFNSPDNWYRITSSPEIYGIQEQGMNVTTRDLADLPNSANSFREFVINHGLKPGTGANEGYWIYPQRVRDAAKRRILEAESGEKKGPFKLFDTDFMPSLFRKFGSAHGNRTQASWQVPWSGSTSTTLEFPKYILEGSPLSDLTIPYGLQRSNFKILPIEEIPRGGRVGFKTGEMPLEGLRAFRELPNGRFRYEGTVVPNKTIRIEESPEISNVPIIDIRQSLVNQYNTNKYIRLLGKAKDSDQFKGSIEDRSIVTRPFAEYLEKLGINSSLFTEKDLNTLIQMRSKLVQRTIPQTGRSAISYETKPKNQQTVFSIDINENGTTLGEISARSHNPNHPRANEVPIDMVSRVEVSPSRGLSEDAYNAAIDYVKQTGIGEGLVSGERLLSPEITYNVWKHYPNRQLLRTNGHHTFGTGRDVVGQPVSETHKGPVVMLTEPSKTPLPMKSNSIFHPDMIKDGKLLPPDWTKYGIYYSLPLLLGTYGMFTNKKAN